MGLRRSAPFLLIAGLATGQALAPTGDLKFEVASLKPSAPDSNEYPGAHPTSGGTRYIGSREPLRVYLSAAYQLKPDQIAGGPGWLDTERYDLNAEAAKPSTLNELHAMLGNLLGERMKLRYHMDKRQAQAYVLTAKKDAANKLKLHPDARGADFLLEQTLEQSIHVKWTAHCASMDLLVFWLGQNVELSVVNDTGLDGCWDFGMTFVRGAPPEPGKEMRMINGTLVDTSGPRIFDALEEQLGLKLEIKRAMVDTMVIDYAERPDQD